jgi:Fe2+ transport system protein FeoA
MAHEFLPLDALRPGCWAAVVDLLGDSAQLQRLEEVGIRPGAHLRMIQPGCPCLFQLGASRVSLRCGDDIQILVRPLTALGLVEAEVA